jgi:hypothetical protein
LNEKTLRASPRPARLVLEQDADGVTVMVRDLPFEGEMDLAARSHRLSRRPFALRGAPAQRPILAVAAARRRHWRDRAGLGPLGAAVERVADRVGCDINQPPPDVDGEATTKIVHGW